jgi:hypothetical protein
LTEFGVWVAHTLEPTQDKEVPTGANLTSQFLKERLTLGRKSELYGLLYAALASKMPMSSATGQIHDHIQTFLMKMVRRDALRSRLEIGASIPNSLLATYAVRSGWTDARNSAMNPICRQLFGARTARERLKAAAREEEGLDAHIQSVGSQAGSPVVVGQNDGGLSEIKDFRDQVATIDRVESKIEFDQMWTRVASIMQTRQPAEWERYMELINLHIQGYTLREISERDAVDQAKLISMVAEIRKVCKAARADNLLPRYE